MKATSRVLTGLFALPTLFVASQAAGFTGDFAVTPPDAGAYSTSQTFGTWKGEISQGVSDSPVAFINTSGAPNSVTLTANDQVISPQPFGLASGRNAGLQTEPAPAYAELTIAAPTSGTFSFSYSLDPLGDAAFLYLENGAWTPFDRNSNTLSLILDAGEVFGFRVENSTVLDLNLIDQPTSRGAALANGGPIVPILAESLIIRSPTFEPVPEASTVAGGVFLAGLAGWVCLRARRQA